jgi:hypothetical protein
VVPQGSRKSSWPANAQTLRLGKKTAGPAALRRFKGGNGSARNDSSNGSMSMTTTSFVGLILCLVFQRSRSREEPHGAAYSPRR